MRLSLICFEAQVITVPSRDIFPLQFSSGGRTKTLQERLQTRLESTSHQSSDGHSSINPHEMNAVLARKKLGLSAKYMKITCRRCHVRQQPK